MELDLAWAIRVDRTRWNYLISIRKISLWHVKDLDSTHQNILPVGGGTIDFKRIFAAETAGLQYYFIEHDMPKDPWDSIQKSIVVLKQLAPVS
jgi:sugar phosphate isomerase/epimerase